MSDIPAGPFDIERELTRLARDRAETDKLIAESHKLLAEQLKLAAETDKLRIDRWLAPTLAIAAVAGGMLGVASFIAKLMGP